MNLISFSLKPSKQCVAVQKVKKKFGLYRESTRIQVEESNSFSLQIIGASLP